MAIYEIGADQIRKIEETTFSVAGLQERGDLQRLLRRQIDVIAPGTIVVSEEFGDWEDSKRRIDLLGVIGRFKTRHLWALQMPPGCEG